MYQAEIKEHDEFNDSIICHNCKKSMRHSKFYVGAWVEWLVCSPKCLKILQDDKTITMNDMLQKVREKYPDFDITSRHISNIVRV